MPVQYHDVNETYPEPKGKVAKLFCAEHNLIAVDNHWAEEGTLEITVNEKNEVINHQIFTNKEQQEAGEQSLLLYKNTKHIKAGDGIKFLYEAINMTPGKPSEMRSTTSDFIRFSENPKFGTELLAFVDAETGGPFKFYYAMRAKDIADKSTMTQPTLAPAEMPTCEKLTATRKGLLDVSNVLQSTPTTIVKFHDPIGDAFDEAMATLLHMASVPEIEKNADFVNTVISGFFSDLYTPQTFDPVDLWKWDKVPWTNVKSTLNKFMPIFDTVYQQECPK